jgi:gluconolactonase
MKHKQAAYQVLLDGLKFPESPFFDSSGNLWFVELKGGNLSRWDGQTLHRYDVDGTPNGAAIDADGVVWFCDSARGAVRKFFPDTQSLATACCETTDGQALKRPNDLIIDSKGNVLFSDHADGRREPLSTVCVLPHRQNKCRVIASEKLFTNGLALTKTEKQLVFAETYNQQLWIGDWNAVHLKLENLHSFAPAGTAPAGPDGIAFDDRGRLCVTVYGEARILVFDEEGRARGEIPCPGACPTSCVYDIRGTLGLVVTEAEKGALLAFPENFDF